MSTKKGIIKRIYKNFIFFILFRYSLVRIRGAIDFGSKFVTSALEPQEQIYVVQSLQGQKDFKFFQFIYRLGNEISLACLCFFIVVITTFILFLTAKINYIILSINVLVFFNIVLVKYLANFPPRDHKVVLKDGKLRVPLFFEPPKSKMFLASAIIDYFTISIIFANCYLLLVIFHPGSFSSIYNGTVPSFMDYLYYSILTITTFGSTDLRPITATGKILTIAEILTGISYIVLHLGILISIYIDERLIQEKSSEEKLIGVAKQTRKYIEFIKKVLVVLKNNREFLLEKAAEKARKIIDMVNKGDIKLGMEEEFWKTMPEKIRNLFVPKKGSSVNVIDNRQTSPMTEMSPDRRMVVEYAFPLNGEHVARTLRIQIVELEKLFAYFDFLDLHFRKTIDFVRGYPGGLLFEAVSKDSKYMFRLSVQ